jgi:hypothetical protein
MENVSCQMRAWSCCVFMDKCVALI